MGVYSHFLCRVSKRRNKAWIICPVLVYACAFYNTIMLIIDSGVGGLSIVKEIHQRCPHLSLNYLMDDGFFPYGTKSDQELKNRLKHLCEAAIKQLAPKLIVIACNTASTLVLDELRTEFNLPFIGVVPAIKVASEQSNNGHIGLLATPATVQRPYIDELIEKFAKHCHVRRLGSDKLVLWAEQYLQGQQPTPLFAHLNHWLTQPQVLSHVVLGCTHFPLLKPVLTQHWPHINWIDSGYAIAQRVQTLSTHLPAPKEVSAGLFYTGKTPPTKAITEYLNALLPVLEVRPLSLPISSSHLGHQNAR